MIFVVLAAINFDNETGLKASKIDNEMTKRNLSAESCAAHLPMANCLPELFLGIRHVLP